MWPPAAPGVYNNGQDWRRSPRLAKAVTLPEHFRAGGYRGLRWRKDFPLSLWINDGYGKQQNEAKLWDRYWPAANRPMPEPLWPKATEAKRATNGYLYSKPIAVGKSTEGRPPHFFDWAPDPQPESKTADHQVVDWAIGELMQRRSQPFFKAVGIFRPHIPWYAPEKYFALYPEAKVFLPKIKKDDLADVPPAATVASARHGTSGW